MHSIERIGMFQKILLLLLVLTSLQTFSQQEDINIISWNIQDFGKTKSNDELNEMAELLRDGYFGSFCATLFGVIVPGISV